MFMYQKVFFKKGRGGALIEGDGGGGGHLYRVIRGEGVTYAAPAL